MLAPLQPPRGISNCSQRGIKQWKTTQPGPKYPPAARHWTPLIIMASHALAFSDRCRRPRSASLSSLSELWLCRDSKRPFCFGAQTAPDVPSAVCPWEPRLRREVCSYIGHAGGYRPANEAELLCRTPPVRFASSLFFRGKADVSRLCIPSVGSGERVNAIYSHRL